MRLHLVANTIVDNAWDTDLTLCPLKFQKLLYFTCGFYMARTNEKLFKEPFYAYPYGPLEKKSYRAFSHYGPRGIYGYMSEEKVLKGHHTHAVFQCINAVIESYGFRDDLDLANETHRRDGPWFDAWTKKPRGIIKSESIKEHFLPIAKAALD